MSQLNLFKNSISASIKFIIKMSQIDIDQGLTSPHKRIYPQLKNDTLFNH